PRRDHTDDALGLKYDLRLGPEQAERESWLAFLSPCPARHMLLRVLQGADRGEDVGHQGLFAAAMSEILAHRFCKLICMVDKQSDRAVDAVCPHGQAFGHGRREARPLRRKHLIHALRFALDYRRHNPLSPMPIRAPDQADDQVAGCNQISRLVKPVTRLAANPSLAATCAPEENPRRTIERDEAFAPASKHAPGAKCRLRLSSRSARGAVSAMSKGQRNADRAGGYGSLEGSAASPPRPKALERR